MTTDKTNPKYLANPKLHYVELLKFRDLVKFRILGEQEKQHRGELEFLLSRTERKIKEVGGKLLP